MPQVTTIRLYVYMSLLQDDVKKRKIISEEENSEDKEPEEGECSESENDDISDEITPDVSTNSESDYEDEPGLLFLVLSFILFHNNFAIIMLKHTLKVNNINFDNFYFTFDYNILEYIHICFLFY